MVNFHWPGHIYNYTVNFIFAEKRKLKRKRKKLSDSESDLDGMSTTNYNVHKLPHEFITANYITKNHENSKILAQQIFPHLWYTVIYVKFLSDIVWYRTISSTFILHDNSITTLIL